MISNYHVIYKCIHISYITLGSIWFETNLHKQREKYKSLPKTIRSWESFFFFLSSLWCVLDHTDNWQINISLWIPSTSILFLNRPQGWLWELYKLFWTVNKARNIACACWKAIKETIRMVLYWNKCMIKPVSTMWTKSIYHAIECFN